MKVAIFGGTGFVGHYILKELENNSYSPQILIRKGSESKISPSKNYTIILGDIFDEVAIQKTLQDADVIIYNIGIIREFKRKGITFSNLHYKGLKNIIKEAEKLNIKRFILMSANVVKMNCTGYQTTKYYG